MALESGTQLGHYEVIDQIGKGGMGEVYRARDTKLGREVAIKVLPSEFSQDPERLARLEREAKLLASLNHPNIAAIHGLEESDGNRFLVLELVEGDTMADRLKNGAIPVEESLKLALQMAEALEAAHEKGVIHRDLKPANIKITPEGRVKVLDFGLAKAFIGEQADVNLSNSPTLSMAATQAGIILGTAAYMSPEQIEGEAADSRSDVWSFGVVLSEMLAGRQTFDGKTVPRVLAAVLNSEPDWTRLPSALHPRIRILLDRLLEKDRKERLSSISDARVEIQKVLTDPDGVVVQPAPEVVQPWLQSKLLLTAGILLGVVVGGWGVWLLRTAPRPGTVIRLAHPLPEDDGFTPFGQLVTVSPDGTKIVYVANEQLYVRNIGELEAHPIPGTNTDPVSPFFSPGGEWIGFQSNERLMKIPVGGGVAIPLADVRGGTRDPNWEDDDMILYAQPEGIMRVSANGGTPQTLIAGQGLISPRMLPNGGLLFTQQGQVMVQATDSEEVKPLFEGRFARYLPTGHLVYQVQDVLFAVPFDVDSLMVTGGSVAMVEGVSGQPPQFALSETGTLVYLPGSFAEPLSLNLVLLDREGNPEVLPAGTGNFGFPRFSPDGTRIAVEVDGGVEGANIWIYETETGLFNQYTFTGGERPVWSPDGSRITFLNDEALWTIPSDQPGASPELLPGTDIPGNTGPGSWSPSGDTLLFATAEGIHAWEAENSSETARVIVQSPDAGFVSDPEFFPDGRWFTYSSSAPGTGQIYASEYPRGDSLQRITGDRGGDGGVWVRDRNELIYEENIDPFGLALIEFTTTPTLTRTSNSIPLASLSQYDTLNTYTQRRRNFDVLANGQQLVGVMSQSSLTDAAVAAEDAPEIRIVVNWVEELRERVPVP